MTNKSFDHGSGGFSESTGPYKVVICLNLRRGARQRHPLSKDAARFPSYPVIFRVPPRLTLNNTSL